MDSYRIQETKDYAGDDAKKPALLQRGDRYFAFDTGKFYVANLEGVLVEPTVNAPAVPFALTTEVISLTSAQIKTLASTPVDLLPSPGAGEYIRLVNIDWKFNWNTVTFSGARPQVQWESGQLVVKSPFWMFEVEDRFEGSGNGAIVTVREINSKMVLTSDGVDSAIDGDCTMDLYITYQKVTVA